MLTAPIVSVSILCPLGQPKKAIGMQSQIESWLAHSPGCLLASSRSTALVFLFPPRRLFQNGPHCQGFATPQPGARGPRPWLCP
jgi:hypothetical protein